MNIEGYRKNKGKEPIIIDLDSEEEPSAPPNQNPTGVKLEEGKLLVSSAPQPATNLPQPIVTPAEPTPVPTPSPMQS